MDGLSYTENVGDIEKSISKNPLVVDPSFGKIVLFADSGYKVKKLFNQGCSVDYSDDLLLPHKIGVPLGFDSRDDIVYLYANLDAPHLIDLGIQTPGELPRTARLDYTPFKNYFSKDPQILRFIDLFKEREKTEVSDKLKLTPGMTI